LDHDDAVYQCIRCDEVPDSSWPEAILLEAIQDNPSYEGWQQVAGQLAGLGLVRAAGAAYWKASKHASLAAEKAHVYQLWGELELRHGLVELAQSRERVVRRLLGAVDPGSLLELEAERGWVMCKANDPKAFAAMLASAGDNPLDDDPLRGTAGPSLTQRDVRAYFGARQDFSFVVVDETGPLILVACDVTGSGMMVRNEVSVQLTRLRADVPLWAEKTAIDQLAYLTRWSGAVWMLVEDDHCQAVKDWMAGHPHQINHMSYCDVDLSQDMEAIRRAYRETHRQQVGWGRRNLRVEKVADPASLFDGFCELYRTGSGLAPQFTPQSLGQPGVHMYVAWQDDALASVVVVTDHGRTSYYTAGARMPGSKKPLTHVLIDAAIEDARFRNMMRFSLGALHGAGTDDSKLQGIAGFKRGFAAQLRPVQWLTMKG